MLWMHVSKIEYRDTCEPKAALGPSGSIKKRGGGKREREVKMHACDSRKVNLVPNQRGFRLIIFDLFHIQSTNNA